MNIQEYKDYVTRMAQAVCARRHQEVPESKRVTAPCPECRLKTAAELNAKRAKMHGRQLTAREAAQVRKRLGLE